jgi:predicted short-subunit dehydrogenase-like oxidoreductase (DUF2520 family)
MRIVIIGSGNVATVLGRLCKQKGHEINQVISRNRGHARILADELDCLYGDYGDKPDDQSQIFVVAVADNFLYELNKHFKPGNKLVVHTAGSVSKDVLKDISTNYGVLYPLQSLRKEKDYTADIPLMIDGNTAETVTLIEDFAKTLSHNVALATDEERLKLHVAAVVVSNFTNHLYALAEDFCLKENIDFKVLIPLIKETAERVQSISPGLAQTGPAARNDVFTLDKHIKLLANYPQLKYIYLKLTDSIMKS